MKTCLKISLIMFLIGLALIIAAFFLGEDTFFVTSEDFIDFSKKYEDVNVKEINLNIGASEVEIKNSDVFSIEATDVSGNTFSSDVKDGVWNISEKTPKVTLFSDYTSKIIINVPNDCILEDLTINLGAGQMTIDKINSNDCKIKVGAGELKYKGKIENSIEVDCGAGNVELDIDGIEDEFKYNVKVGVGQIKINDRNYSGLGMAKSINSNAEKLMKLQCGAGRIKVEI